MPNIQGSATFEPQKRSDTIGEARQKGIENCTCSLTTARVLKLC